TSRISSPTDCVIETDSAPAVTCAVRGWLPALDCREYAIEPLPEPVAFVRTSQGESLAADQGHPSGAVIVRLPAAASGPATADAGPSAYVHGDDATGATRARIIMFTGVWFCCESTKTSGPRNVAPPSVENQVRRYCVPFVS